MRGIGRGGGKGRVKFVAGWSSALVVLSAFWWCRADAHEAHVVAAMVV